MRENDSHRVEVHLKYISALHLVLLKDSGLQETQTQETENVYTMTMLSEGVGDTKMAGLKQINDWGCD